MLTVSASASAKVVNAGTNLAALAFFAATGQVLWVAGALMAAADLAGGLAGTGVALARGAGFVRAVFLIVVIRADRQAGLGPDRRLGPPRRTALIGRRRGGEVPRETIRTGPTGRAPRCRPHLIPKMEMTPVAAYIRMRPPPIPWPLAKI